MTRSHYRGSHDIVTTLSHNSLRTGVELVLRGHDTLARIYRPRSGARSQLLVQSAPARCQLDLKLVHAPFHTSEAPTLGRNEKPGARLRALSNRGQLAPRLVLLLSKQIDP